MIVITNGINTLEVTSGAYKDIFKAQGFQVVSGDMPTRDLAGSEKPSTLKGVILRADSPEPSEDVLSGKNDHAANEAENTLSRKEQLAEIPLNEMTPDQLKEYAKLLGVDIRGLKNKTAVKDKIRSVL